MAINIERAAYTVSENTVCLSKNELTEANASEGDEKAALGGVTKRGFEVVRGRDRILLKQDWTDRPTLSEVATTPYVAVVSGQSAETADFALIPKTLGVPRSFRQVQY